MRRSYRADRTTSTTQPTLMGARGGECGPSVPRDRRSLLDKAVRAQGNGWGPLSPQQRFSPQLRPGAATTATRDSSIRPYGSISARVQWRRPWKRRCATLFAKDTKGRVVGPRKWMAMRVAGYRQCGAVFSKFAPPLHNPIHRLIPSHSVVFPRNLL